MSKKPSTPFEIIQSTEQHPPFQILPKSILRPKVRSTQKTLLLRHLGSPSVLETPEPLNLSSSDRSSLIFVDSYVARSSFTFLMCNASQRGQLWMVADSSACNLKSVSLIAADMRNMQISPTIRDLQSNNSMEN